MTGLESVEELPVVREYLFATQQGIGNLMPGWQGWDRPHLIRYGDRRGYKRAGGIVPTSPETLLDRARRWKKWATFASRRLPRRAIG